MDELQKRYSFSNDAIYALMASQAKSYLKKKSLEKDSSVSQEVAMELLLSIEFTLSQCSCDDNLQDSFAKGQAIVAEKAHKAQKLLVLLETSWDECNPWLWQTICEIRVYLQHYDPVHFAHQKPQFLSYPLLLREISAAGIEYTLHYLQCLWLELQVIHAFSCDAFQELMDALPPDYWAGPQNSCEQLLCSALGRSLLELSLDCLLLEPWQAVRVKEKCTIDLMEKATQFLCNSLKVGAQVKRYACMGCRSLFVRIEAAAAADNIAAVFPIRRG